MLFRSQIVENLTIFGFILMLIRIQYWNHVETTLSKMTCVPLTEKRKKKVWKEHLMNTLIKELNILLFSHNFSQYYK